MLSEIDRIDNDFKIKEFSLIYITTDGRRKISSGLVKSGAKYNVKRSGNLPLFNNSTQKHEHVKIDLITHFNGKRVWH